MLQPAKVRLGAARDRRWTRSDAFAGAAVHAAVTPWPGLPAAAGQTSDRTEEAMPDSDDGPSPDGPNPRTSARSSLDASP
jgi:hypothetical protein